MKKLVFIYFVFVNLFAFGQASWMDGISKFNKNDYLGAMNVFSSYINENVQNKANTSIAINLYYCYLYRGIARFYTFDNMGAQNDFNDCIKLEPSKKYKSQAYLYNGLVDYYRGNNEKALESINKSAEIDEKNSDAFLCRGIIFKKTGKTTEADADFNKILEIEKKKGYNRCLAYFYLGKATEAETEVANLIADKKDSWAYYNAACVYALLNKTDEAVKNLELALNNGYRCYIYIFNDSQLNSIRGRKEFTDILRKYRADIIINNFFIEAEKDSILAAKKINSHLYIANSYDHQFIFPNNKENKILEKAPEVTIPFGFLFNENYFNSFNIPTSNDFQYEWKVDIYNSVKADFSLSELEGLQNFRKEIQTADQFTIKENQSKYRKEFIDSWKYLNNECTQNYLKKDSIYVFRMVTNKDFNADKSYYCLLDKQYYSLDRNLINVPLIIDQNDNMGIYHDYHTSCYEFPEIFDIDPKYRFVNITITPEKAKDMIRGGDVYYEKIYTVKYKGGIKTYNYGGWAVFYNNFDIVSVKYNFYKIEQWNKVYNEFIGNPCFEYTYMFPAN